MLNNDTGVLLMWSFLTVNNLLTTFPRWVYTHDIGRTDEDGNSIYDKVPLTVDTDDPLEEQ
ncbi:hypothetical protein ACM26V_00635 [Salipaludibacillus sp. HK11]|uniref:hypothetical protein n=1 Tax=Salipaludibacillus sp. HK11 TaxID=3394320 RepID=UPI0039FC71E3